MQGQINRLRLERDELLAQAISDTRVRTQLQKDMIALDDKVKNVLDGLRKSQATMRCREHETDQLHRRLATLKHRLRADEDNLDDASRAVDDFSACFVYRAGKFCRVVFPRITCVLWRVCFGLSVICENAVPLFAAFRDV